MSPTVTNVYILCQHQWYITDRPVMSPTVTNVDIFCQHQWYVTDRPMMSPTVINVYILCQHQWYVTDRPVMSPTCTNVYILCQHQWYMAVRRMRLDNVTQHTIQSELRQSTTRKFKVQNSSFYHKMTPRGATLSLVMSSPSKHILAIHAFEM